MNSEKITISFEDAAADFSALTAKADEFGSIIILKDGVPKYKLTDIDQNPEIEMTEDEKIDFVAARILRTYHKAFEELAK